MRNRRVLLIGATMIAFASASAQEICTNGIDDDADALIDLNDTTDCACDPTIVAIPDMIANPSFEEIACCPQTYSELYCADSWVQASNATSDYFNMCGWFPPWIPTPLPGGGVGCVGGYLTEGYQESIGACLLQPMLAGHTYEMKLSVAAFLAELSSLATTVPINFGPIDLILYGAPECGLLPAPTNVCPDAFGWSPLGTATYGPSEQWQEVIFIIEPTFDVDAIIIGTACDLPPDYGMTGDPDPYYPYFLYDALSLSDIGQIYAQITSSGTLCNFDLILTSDPDNAATGFQWFADGVALPGQTDTVLHVTDLGLGQGSYQFMFQLDTICAYTFHNVAAPVFPEPAITWNGNVLVCDAVGSYQWFLNGSPIADADSQWHIPLENGNYIVTVTNEEGCTGVSEPFAFNGVGFDVPAEQGLIVIHQPGTDLLEVKGATQPFILQLYDATGKLMTTQRGSEGGWQFSMRDLPSGLYLARIGELVTRVVR